MKIDLVEAGRKVKEAEALRDKAMLDVRRGIVEAKENGIPITWIAAQAGVSRQTVYTILNEELS